MLSNLQMRRARLMALSAAQTTAAATAARDAGLEVTDLATFPMREPVSRRAYTIVRLRTRSGMTGYGECGQVTPADLPQALQAVKGMQATAFEVVARALAPLGGLRAAINSALLDIVGKAAKAPVYQVLGGSTKKISTAKYRMSNDEFRTA